MITIAIPNTKAPLPLTEQLHTIAKDRFRVLQVSEDQCAELLLTNKVDLALLTPLGYGIGVSSVDFRIVPTTCLFTEGFSGHAGIAFREGSVRISTVSTPNPKDFLAIAGLIALREKFDVTTDLALGETGDAVIYRTDATGKTLPLDVSEEWYDAIEDALPVALWVCKAEPEEGFDPVLLTNAFASPTLEPIETVTEPVTDTSDFIARVGTAFYRWNQEREQSLTKTMHTLFYHGFVPEIPAVKIWGRD